MPGPRRELPASGMTSGTIRLPRLSGWGLSYGLGLVSYDHDKFGVMVKVRLGLGHRIGVYRGYWLNFSFI